MTTTTDNKITIRLSDAAPVRINPDHWPVIAQANAHDNAHRSQANNLWAIVVREHEDGRRIVYGARSPGNGGQHVGTINPFAGFKLRAFAGHSAEQVADETIRAIRRVAGVIDRPDLGAECIADLPAVEL